MKATEEIGICDTMWGGKYHLVMCNYYTTTGYPHFKPRCKKGRFASLKCHSENICPLYVPRETKKKVQD